MYMDSNISSPVTGCITFTILYFLGTIFSGYCYMSTSNTRQAIVYACIASLKLQHLCPNLSCIERFLLFQETGNFLPSAVQRVADPGKRS